MKLVDAIQIRDLDNKCIDNYKINGLLLMEHAALSVYQYIIDNIDVNKKIILLVGPGNNGGDALALARLLYCYDKHKFEVVMLCGYDALSNFSKQYYDICSNLKIDINRNLSSKELFDLLNRSDVIVDAIFGTGLNKNVEGKYLDAIEVVNHLDKLVISIDIPSGINATTGAVMNKAIKADVTITFALAKLGLYLYPGIEYSNKVIISKIGIPKEAINECSSNTILLNKDVAKTLLPNRYLRSNKGTYGKVLIIGGSKSMSGALCMSALSCIKSGAGTTTVALPKCIHEIVATNVLEGMEIPLEDDGNYISATGITNVLSIIDIYDIIAVGPGLGREDINDKLIKELLLSDKPLVIDADGIYALKNNLELLNNRDNDTIITPHPGEFAYLLDISIKELLKNPIQYVNEFVNKYDVTLVLKLERSIIANKKITYLNTTGNNGLSKGGSGDVLTGIITALFAQSLKCIESAALGVYLHGLIADVLLDEFTVYAITPTELIKNINRGFKELNES